MSWLDPVRAALDARASAALIFFRDDDAGWDDARLRAMLHLFTRWSAPLDVAVIPVELTASLTRLLHDQPGSVRLHQHGYAHVNHEPAGRKYEFGPSRAQASQTADIATGRAILIDAFGTRIDPIFTPPWNRCTADTGEALADLGIPILSRDHTAAQLGRAELIEIPVTVDWFGRRRGVRWTPGELAQRLADGISGSEPVGVMLHHAVTDDDERIRVAELVRLVADHASTRLTHLLALADFARPSW